MGKKEKEVKILNINKEEIEKKLLELGAKKIESGLQKIYVYDLHTIYSRFYDCMLQLKNCSRSYQYDVCRNKLKILLNEVDNLISEEEKKSINAELNFNSLVEFLDNTKNEELINKFSLPIIIDLLKKYEINPNKWIRLRQTNGTTTITIKHILNKENKDEKFQNVEETEMKVDSIEKGNAILEQLGFAFRNYQEKERTTYIFKGSEIDIDTWPLIPTYLEIEEDSYEKIQMLISELGLDDYECVSCNTDEIYKKYGINIYEYRVIKNCT